MTNRIIQHTPRSVLSIGSNLGDRLANMQSVVDEFRSEILAISPVYSTAPWGGVEQDDFLNAVLLIRADDPDKLLQRTQELERDARRVREVRWGPRTLDVDIVDFDGISRTTPDLILPHPRAQERAFVLAPWADVEPDATLPGYGPIRELLSALADQGVARTELELS
jgi:2-amino-4-hydroxy-6-hydroxymethyldihydropteridine diphosphokinase